MSLVAPKLIPRNVARISWIALILFIAICAIINVPWALTRMRSRDTRRLVPNVTLDATVIPRQWPSATPHASPWPAPEQWDQATAFGCRMYNVFGTGDVDQKRFQMEVQHLGWPLPVIELKQMWWDWNDPSLAGVESDPAPSLVLSGLVFNPLIIGGGLWTVLVLPWLIANIAMRSSRRRRHRCMNCAYPIGESPLCTECGTEVR